MTVDDAGVIMLFFADDMVIVSETQISCKTVSTVYTSIV